MQRRARLFRRGRMAVLALVIAYFFLPYSIQAVIPVWLLFLAALGLEVEFFLGGYRQAQRGQPAAELDRGPQQRDLSELGRWAWWESDPAIALRKWTTAASAGSTSPRRPSASCSSRESSSTPCGPRAGTPSAPLTARAPRPSSRTRPRSSQAIRREIGCDASGEYVGFVQDADGLAFVGGDQAYLTPSICNTLYQLRFKHRSEPFSQDGPRARRPRARVAAPPRRARRGPRQLLRLPERRRDRRPPRPLRENGARDDARAARDERFRLRAQRAVPRSKRMPQRRLSRSASELCGFPVVITDRGRVT